MKLICLALVAGAAMSAELRLTSNGGSCSLKRSGSKVASTCDISTGITSINGLAGEVAALKTDVKNLKTAVAKLQATDIVHAAGIAKKAQKGETGAKGARGYTGARGAQGIKGATGQKGATGARGYTGARGLTGSKGQKGQTGNTGARGYTGSKGQKGQTGSRGYTGSKGQKGQTGNTGARGSTGAKGQKGETGKAQPQWVHVISTRNNNGVWSYNGNAWGNNGSFNNGNGLLDCAYSQMPIKSNGKIRVTMNGRSHEFTIAPGEAGSTLKDLATHARAHNLFHSKSWKGGHTNPWGFPRNGHEQWICHEFSGNYRYYDPHAHAYARLGYSMSQEYGCGHPGTTEGVGLVESNHNDQLASGRLQWAGESNHYYQAEVYVYGVPPACSYAA